jgi:hypothetical protein
VTRRAAAAVGMVLWGLGALLLFVVPGGLWSDLPGATLLVVGLGIELACTVAIATRKLAGRG